MSRLAVRRIQRVLVMIVVGGAAMRHEIACFAEHKEMHPDCGVENLRQAVDNVCRSISRLYGLLPAQLLPTPETLMEIEAGAGSAAESVGACRRASGL